MSNQLSMDLCGIEIKDFTIEYNPNLEDERYVLRYILNATPNNFDVYFAKYDEYNKIYIYYIVDSLYVCASITYSKEWVDIPTSIGILFQYLDHHIIAALSKYTDNPLKFYDNMRKIIAVDPNPNPGV